MIDIIQHIPWVYFGLPLLLPVSLVILAPFAALFALIYAAFRMARLRRR